MACKHVIHLTATAEKFFVRLFCLAQTCLSVGDDSNSKVLIFNKLVEALENTIPHDPFSQDRALSGPLASVYRVSEEPLRIYYTGERNKPKLTVLYIAEGPIKSGYNIFAKWVMANNDEMLAQFGVTPPDRSKMYEKPRFQ